MVRPTFSVQSFPTKLGMHIGDRRQLEGLPINLDFSLLMVLFISGTLLHFCVVRQQATALLFRAGCKHAQGIEKGVI